MNAKQLCNTAQRNKICITQYALASTIITARSAANAWFAKV